MAGDLSQDARRGLRQFIAQSRAARFRAVRASFAEQGWDVGYGRRLLVSDTVAVLIAVVVAWAWRWRPFEGAKEHTAGYIGGDFPYLIVALTFGLAWVSALTIVRSRDGRVMGVGPTEYHRVFGASWRVFAAFALLSFFVKFREARGFIAVSFGLGLTLILVGRYAWRRVLHRLRANGSCKAAVLAIGHRDQAERLIREMNANPTSAYRVVGVCIPTGQVAEGEMILGVPVLGDLRQAGAIAAQVCADTVAVSGSDQITADVVRRLGWELEPQGVDLMLTAELTDVAGPRITITPAESISLLHVDAPRFTGPRYAIKTVTDWVGAGLLTLVLFPVLLISALAVGLTSPGGVFYRQVRVGRNGQTFRMFKFRSMRVGADAEVASLAAMNDGSGPLFKMRDDPRVTKVGKIMRRYSIDELPQLFNVLRGEMSLVGPRPPLPSEVSAYEKKVRRRLLVKPGLTGLWQVGGRSDLSWEESVRLDVYYVENWTVFGDMIILAKTARAVFSGAGAY